MPAALKLRPLQQRLERLYEVAIDHDVDDFITTDTALAALDRDGCSAQEKLLVRTQADTDDLDLALYLDADLIGRLSDDNPTDCLHDGNIGDFCTALEGVSHFLYLTWNAGHRRSVRPLELELQAEIDKYVLSWVLLSRHDPHRRRRPGSSPVPRRLHRWLFKNFALAPGLNALERRRYRDANRYASRYCRLLEIRYLGKNRDQRAHHQGNTLLNELRRFYRLSLQSKLRYIDSVSPVLH